jgi:DNA-directed RNA polymerase subunit H (RpoH/RPB5)
LQRYVVLFFWIVTSKPEGINIHVLQPKHSKLDEKESEKILTTFNISKSQLPKILLNDPALPEGCNVGDIIKIERIEKDNLNKKGKISEDAEESVYFRVVV